MLYTSVDSDPISRGLRIKNCKIPKLQNFLNKIRINLFGILSHKL